MQKHWTSEQYDQFEEQMIAAFPKIFNKSFGGFDIAPGWWPIVEKLCKTIQEYIDHRERTRSVLLNGNPYGVVIPDSIDQVTVAQIKEKFGGLRFYYDGGDDKICGMVSMAERWAGSTCQECGQPGELRTGGWIRTLCDHHEAEYQRKIK